LKFWDASAVVPLLIEEPIAKRVAGIYRGDPFLVVWWGAEVECASALARREREGSFGASAIASAFGRLDALQREWNEVEPSVEIRRVARRLLRTYPLRASDALQLAAALDASNEEPVGMPFVCLDRRLADAAEREGLTVLGPA
jgi:predicted nucleic acid-binding protein